MEQTNPFPRFRDVYERAGRVTPVMPEACALATVGLDGRPSVRTVLLKSWDESGFVFYTNTLSRKGRELARTPLAALCFYWPALFESVRIEGSTTPVSPSEADEYFQTRPRESQIGAWASNQSEPLASRAELDARVTRLEAEYQDRVVPRPSHWSGYRLIPDAIEFWVGRVGRLHDRELYTRSGAGWTTQLLNP